MLRRNTKAPGIEIYLSFILEVLLDKNQKLVDKGVTSKQVLVWQHLVGGFVAAVSCLEIKCQQRVTQGLKPVGIALVFA